jgi:SAM-dependent methyltransferase
LTAALDLHTCCALTYGHPLTRALLGDSLHPGGLELTTRLASLTETDSGSRVLDVGSGLGATAVHLARTVGCHVTAVTLESEGLTAGRERARLDGVVDRVRFIQDDILSIDMGQEQFDSVFMECVLSIFEDKDAVLGRLRGMLRSGGRIGLTDVTVNGPLPVEMQGLLATAGCVGGALSLDAYGALLEGDGFVVEVRRDCPDITKTFMAGLRDKLLAAELAAKLGRLPIETDVLVQAQHLLALARDLVSRRVIGYGLLVARNPGQGPHAI